MTEKTKEIPYGISDFALISKENGYYVDKTTHIPLLEKSRYLFLIRPRRFGKSLFISMLHYYYDILYLNKFEELFKDTFIYKNPTENKNKYMIMYFNFSVVDKSKHKVQEDFNDYCKTVIIKFLDKYKCFFKESLIHEISALTDTHKMLYTLATSQQEYENEIYILIDEYDNFTNTILANYGSEEYMRIAKQEGYFKQFFTSLKALTSGADARLSRLFITGVSPVTMDDVTSGFNIGTNISLEPLFKDILGFKEEDIHCILDYYTQRENISLDKKEILDILKKWYGGYLFSYKAKEPLYNTDAILYFIRALISNKELPENLIDHNLRMDYSKLRYLTLLDQKLNGNFKNLTEIIDAEKISSPIAQSFPQKDIALPQNFISLLYYLGLLTFSGYADKSIPVLTIPNQTIKTMIYEYFQESIKSAGGFHIDPLLILNLMSEMAYDGNYKNAIHTLAHLMTQNTSVRDLMTKEKTPQIFFLAYFLISDLYITKSEPEYHKGYADLALIPFLAKYPDVPYAYLIEFKYLKTDLKEEPKAQEKAIEDATLQLQRYEKSEHLQKELLKAREHKVQLKKIIVIFQGAELKYCEEI